MNKTSICQYNSTMMKLLNFNNWHRWLRIYHSEFKWHRG